MESTHLMEPALSPAFDANDGTLPARRQSFLARRIGVMLPKNWTVD